MVVLPFANLSSDPEQDYFADAVTAERSALEVLKPDEDRDYWSVAQGDLGAALSGVGQRDNSIDWNASLPGMVANSL